MHPRTGTAGWSIPSASAARFAGPGPHLERYARVLRCAEIDSSFYRPHRRSTYERWAASTPADFRFAVKLPRTITHERRLRSPEEPLDAFLEQAGGLGEKLGPLLAQLPPSLAFDARTAGDFFERLRRRGAGSVVCEPRHRSWFSPEADALLKRHRVSRVAADPAIVPAAAQPGGWLGPKEDGAGAILYHRWHGSPRMYWSRYDAGWLSARRRELGRWPQGSAGADCWCVFDNTAAGAAIENALELAEPQPAAPGWNQA